VNDEPTNNISALSAGLEAAEIYSLCELQRRSLRPRAIILE
jgi:hypothetical protein